MWLIRLKTFVKSLLFHIYGGFPKSTKQEILYRYSICLGCDEFNKVKSQCNVCGCAISQQKKFLNKLAWADQECPMGNWPKIQR
jgi:hypothetical protein